MKDWDRLERALLEAQAQAQYATNIAGDAQRRVDCLELQFKALCRHLGLWCVEGDRWVIKPRPFEGQKT